MRQSRQLIESLRLCLKNRGIRYRDLALRLGQSEANVKRIFSQQTISLHKFEELCDVAGLSILEVAKIADPQASDEAVRFDEKQETVLASNERLFSFFYLLLAGFSLARIQKDFDFSAREISHFMVKLERVNLLRARNEQKYHLLVPPNVKWIDGGPLHQNYADEIKRDFLNSNFKGSGERFRFLQARLSPSSQKILEKKIEQLVASFLELETLDRTEAKVGDRHTWLMVACRPWRFSRLKHIQRRR